MDNFIIARMMQELHSILEEYAECLAVHANRYTSDKAYAKFQYIKEYAENVLSCTIYWDIEWTDVDKPICTVTFKDFEGKLHKCRG